MYSPFYTKRDFSDKYFLFFGYLLILVLLSILLSAFTRIKSIPVVIFLVVFELGFTFLSFYLISPHFVSPLYTVVSYLLVGVATFSVLFVNILFKYIHDYAILIPSFTLLLLYSMLWGRFIALNPLHSKIEYEENKEFLRLKITHYYLRSQEVLEYDISYSSLVVIPKVKRVFFWLHKHRFIHLHVFGESFSDINFIPTSSKGIELLFFLDKLFDKFKEPPIIEDYSIFQEKLKLINNGIVEHIYVYAERKKLSDDRVKWSKFLPRLMLKSFIYGIAGTMFTLAVLLVIAVGIILNYQSEDRYFLLFEFPLVLLFFMYLVFLHGFFNNNVVKSIYALLGKTEIKFRGNSTQIICRIFKNQTILLDVPDRIDFIVSKNTVFIQKTLFQKSKALVLPMGTWCNSPKT